MPRRDYGIQIKLTDEEKSAYSRVASRKGVRIQEWARQILNYQVLLEDIGLERKAISRELSAGERDCPTKGCSLSFAHNGPCMPRVGETETPQIIERNLLLLAQDDPEGFRLRVRELLAGRGERRATSELASPGDER